MIIKHSLFTAPAGSYERLNRLSLFITEQTPYKPPNLYAGSMHGLDFFKPSRATGLLAIYLAKCSFFIART